MQFVAPPPSAALRPYVEYLWSLRDAPGHARERIVPSGTLELVINLREDRFRIFTARDRTLAGAIVSGCYTTAFAIDASVHADVLGVHFRPGCAQLLGIPAGVLANDHVELDALWGRDAVALRERLVAAPTSRTRFGLLDAALCARLGAAPRRDIAWAVAALSAGTHAIGAVAAELALSQRRFIEVFTREVGMTPKRFAMVRRFQRALATMTTEPSWARIALACGYYDQAHLCRDWRALTGVSPSVFATARAVAVKENHLAVGSSSSKPRLGPHA